MISKDSLALNSDQETADERSLRARKFFVGLSIVAAFCVAVGILGSTKSGKKLRKDLGENIVDTAKKVKNTVEQGAETVKASAEKAGRDVHTAIKRDLNKVGAAKNDIRHGYHKIARNVQKTATNVSDDLQ